MSKVRKWGFVTLTGAAAGLCVPPHQRGSQREKQQRCLLLNKLIDTGFKTFLFEYSNTVERK